ncbi:hypothetical protein ACFQ0B_78665 [Nonomuraea thailandensis]
MVQEVLRAVLAGDLPAAEWARIPLPESYKALTVHKDEVGMFDGLPSAERDPDAPFMSSMSRFPSQRRTRFSSR